MKSNQRGEVVTIVLVILGLAGLSQLVPNFRPSNWFKKGPPTAELTAAQKKADDADKKVSDLQHQVQTLETAQAAQKDTQVNYSHEMVTGAIEANNHAPDSTEKAIVDSFLQRADIGLNSAVGKLDPALRTEVINIVAQLRSGDVEKIKAAQDMLAEKDKELAAATTARAKAESDTKTATTKLDAAVKDAATTKELVTAKQAQVVAYADKAFAQEKEAGSLSALVGKLEWILFVGVLILAFANWILPSLAQEFPGIGWLVALNKTIKSVTSAHA